VPGRLLDTPEPNEEKRVNRVVEDDDDDGPFSDVFERPVVILDRFPNTQTRHIPF
jgi:hypothetical protein